MADLVIPNTFSNSPPNTNPIDADQMNANFAAVKAGHDAQEDALEILATYRSLLHGEASIADSAPSGTHVILASGGSRASGASSIAGTPPVGLYIAAADYAITGRTAKLRLRAQLYTNAIAPGITVAVGLHEITGVAGAADAIVYTVGAAVGGSTVAFASQGASSIGQGNSGDFAVPADSRYALCAAVSGAPAADSLMGIAVQLQQRWV